MPERRPKTPNMPSLANLGIAEANLVNYPTLIEHISALAQQEPQRIKELQQGIRVERGIAFQGNFFVGIVNTASRQVMDLTLEKGRLALPLSQVDAPICVFVGRIDDDQTTAAALVRTGRYPGNPIQTERGLALLYGIRGIDPQKEPQQAELVQALVERGIDISHTRGLISIAHDEETSPIVMNPADTLHVLVYSTVTKTFMNETIARQIPDTLSAAPELIQRFRDFDEGREEANVETWTEAIWEEYDKYTMNAHLTHIAQTAKIEAQVINSLEAAFIVHFTKEKTGQFFP